MEKTGRVSGFETGLTLRVRHSAHSISVWRTARAGDPDGPWAWAIIGWDSTGRAWRRISGHAPDQPSAVLLGLGHMHAIAKMLDGVGE